MRYDDWVITLWLFCLCVFSYIAYDDGRKTMVNELCNIKVYDFCQQVSQRYELKEFKE